MISKEIKKKPFLGPLNVLHNHDNLYITVEYHPHKTIFVKKKNTRKNNFLERSKKLKHENLLIIY